MAHPISLPAQEHQQAAYPWGRKGGRGVGGGAGGQAGDLLPADLSLCSAAGKGLSITVERHWQGRTEIQSETATQLILQYNKLLFHYCAKPICSQSPDGAMLEPTAIQSSGLQEGSQQQHKARVMRWPADLTTAMTLPLSLGACWRPCWTQGMNLHSCCSLLGAWSLMQLTAWRS